MRTDFFTHEIRSYGSRRPLGWGVLAGRVMDNRKRLYPGQTVYIRSHTTGQTWQVISYGSAAVRSDPYYQENLVIGDLPAGNYDIRISYLGVLYEQAITIKPGVINYFTFEGRLGFGDPLRPHRPQIILPHRRPDCNQGFGRT